jgi:hypothetical protein
MGTNLVVTCSDAQNRISPVRDLRPEIVGVWSANRNLGTEDGVYDKSSRVVAVRQVKFNSLTIGKSDLI